MSACLGTGWYSMCGLGLAVSGQSSSSGASGVTGQFLGLMVFAQGHIVIVAATSIAGLYLR